MNRERIAIAGIGLRYPDAGSPDDLWENVLAGRRAFRRLPDRQAPRSTDFIHRLAREVAAKALADAGFPYGGGLPRQASIEYTVDGSGSSSLLSVATAAKALAAGDLDLAVAGGVDAFWSGMGCGLVVLMREGDAVARGRRSYASITGWANSADCITRAYGVAGYGVETVPYFEGDGTELETLCAANLPTAALGTLTGTFGHTRAGVAGLIKAALAVHHQVIPPSTGHHPHLTAKNTALYLPAKAELFPAGKEIRAGVSAMGLGGNNIHLALQQAPGLQRRTGLSRHTEAMVAGRQDCELLLLDAPDLAGLRDKVAALLAVVPKLAFAELTDLAGTLALELTGHQQRAAVTASGPEDAERKLTTLLSLLDAGQTAVFSAADGIFAGERTVSPKIAYLFPGQGRGPGAAGAIRRRFPVAEGVYRTAGDEASVVAGSVAALRVLHALGIDADVAVGPGLGELSALAWAGAMDGTQLLRLAAGELPERLAELNFRPLTRPVVSTVTGDLLALDADLLALLRDQPMLPVRFDEAAARAVDGVDLAIEVGPGRVLSGLLSQISPSTRVLAVDTGSQSLSALLGIAGAAFALGVAVDTMPLFADRVLRPLKLDDDFPFTFDEVTLAEGLDNHARTGG